jgi:hypothetical protein
MAAISFIAPPILNRSWPEQKLAGTEAGLNRSWLAGGGVG